MKRGRAREGDQRHWVLGKGYERKEKEGGIFRCLRFTKEEQRRTQTFPKKRLFSSFDLSFTFSTCFFLFFPSRYPRSYPILCPILVKKKKPKKKRTKKKSKEICQLQGGFKGGEDRLE